MAMGASQKNTLIIPPFVATGAEVVSGGGIGESGKEAAVVKEVTELAGSLVAVGVGKDGFVDETGAQLEVFVMTIEGGVGGIGNLGDGIVPHGSVSELRKDCGIDAKTASAWLDVLQSSGLVRLLYPYYNNFTKRN